MTEANPHEHLKAITLRSGKEVGMSEDKEMEKKTEPTIKVSESPMKEGEAIPIIESVPLPGKEHVTRLPYPSRLKTIRTDEQFK